MINIGNTEVSGIYIGSTPVLSAYLGSQLIWGTEEPPIPPTPDPGWNLLSSTYWGAEKYSDCQNAYWFGNDVDNYVNFNNNDYFIESGYFYDQDPAWRIVSGQNILAYNTNQTATGTYISVYDDATFHVYQANKVVEWGTDPIILVNFTAQNITMTYASALATQGGDTGMYTASFSGMTLGVWKEQGYFKIGYGEVQGNTFYTSIVEWYYQGNQTLYRKMIFDSNMTPGTQQTFYFLT